MHKLFTTFQAMDFLESDIDFVRDLRKLYAQQDQNPSLDKQMRKEAQRGVKCCTIILECMTGMRGGKWEGEPLTQWPQIPLELEDKIFSIFIRAIDIKNE